MALQNIASHSRTLCSKSGVELYTTLRRSTALYLYVPKQIAVRLQLLHNGLLLYYVHRVVEQHVLTNDELQSQVAGHVSHILLCCLLELACEWHIGSRH